MITPSGMLTASAVSRCTRISGMRRIDQQQAAERDQHDAADGQHPMGGKLGFCGEERECAQNQHQRGKAGGQQIQREDREQNKDDRPPFPEPPLRDD